MSITVVLCTYNRCASLAKALDSLASSTLPDSVEWEVLVVDNNSTDETRRVVEDFSGRHAGRFRYLFVPEQGKSRALNAGVREARGDILAFTDDDVMVEATWLQNLTAGLHDGAWAGSGGRTLPERSFKPPRWLSKGEPDAFALVPLALFDRGREACELNEAPWGNNMAFRKAMFEKYPGFRTDLGPKPGSEIRAEDTEFGCRLMAAGERLRYEPSAVLYHAVPKDRIRKSYFLRWWFDKARSDVRERGSLPDAKWTVAGIPPYQFLRLTAWTLRWLFAIEPSRRFDCKRELWRIAGSVIESRYQLLAAKRTSEALNAAQPHQTCEQAQPHEG